MTIKGYIMAGGTGYKLGEITAKYNRCGIPKPIVPLGNRRIIDFPIQQLDAILRGQARPEIWINTPRGDENIRKYVDHVSPFFNSYFLFREEEKPIGTAGSLKYLAEQSKLEDEDIAVILNGDIVMDADLAPIIKQHIENSADITMGVIMVKNKEDLANYDTITIPKMPSKSRDDDNKYIEDMRNFLRALQLNKEAISVESYQRRLPWEKALSNLADASIYIVSGRFVNQYMHTRDSKKVIDRPDPANESRSYEDINAVKEAIKIIGGRYHDLVQRIIKTEGLHDGIIRGHFGHQTAWKKYYNDTQMLMGFLYDQLAYFSSQSEAEFAKRFYNMEHVIYHAIKDGKKVNAYIVPENDYWQDIGTKRKVWEVNMDILTRNIHLLRLEDGQKQNLWNKVVVNNPDGSQGICWKGKNVHVDLEDGRCIVKGVVLIGDDCSIEDNVGLNNSIIGPGNIIHRGVNVEESVLFPALLKRPHNEIMPNIYVVKSLFLGGVLGINLSRRTYYTPRDGGNINEL